MDIINKIRQKVDIEGVTPYRIATDIGVKPSVITRILNGTTKNPNPETLEKLKNYLLGNVNAKGASIKTTVFVEPGITLTIEEYKELTQSRIDDYKTIINSLRLENEDLKNRLTECQSAVQRFKKHSSGIPGDL